MIACDYCGNYSQGDPGDKCPICQKGRLIELSDEGVKDKCGHSKRKKKRGGIKRKDT